MRQLIPSQNKSPFYQMIDSFFEDSFPRRDALNTTFKVDIKDEDNQYLIEAELPGIEKENINLEVDQGQLTIQVEQRQEQEEKKANYVHRERSYSSMMRRIFLGEVDEEQMNARLENGILTICVPKKPEIETKRQISIEG